MHSRMALVLVLLFAWSNSSSPASAVTPATEADEIGVSLIRLLAAPARYEGAVVEVTGYLDERGLLFLTKDHAAVFDIETAIRFADPTQNGEILQHCTGSYARVVGTFGVRRDGPVRGDDPSFYVLEKVRRVTTVKDGLKTTTCWEAKHAQGAVTPARP